MTSLSVSPIEVPFNDDSIKIVSIAWSDELGLKVSILSKRSKQSCEVHFKLVSGMRMLHELDLASWWIQIPREARSTGWLYQVKAGGWFAFESSRLDFYSQHEEPDSEYLVAGYDDCLSVFSGLPPVIVASSTREA